MGKYCLSNDSKFVHEITFASSQDVKNVLGIITVIHFTVQKKCSWDLNLF